MALWPAVFKSLHIGGGTVHHHSPGAAEAGLRVPGQPQYQAGHAHSLQRSSWLLPR